MLCVWFVVVFDTVLLMFFFFFQAEDGIRDWSVTGVQTCALPIWRVAELGDRPGGRRVELRLLRRREEHGGRADATRSEEHTSELQSLTNLVCRLLLEKKKKE